MKALLGIGLILVTLSLIPATSSPRQNRASEVAPEFVISVNDPRPLAQAAQQLELKFGTGISYEDAAWTYSGDSIKAAQTDWGRKIAEKNPAFKAVIPAGGSLQIKIPFDRASRRPIPSVNTVLQNVLDQHKVRGNPGEFTFVNLGDDFSIMPTMARDEAGRMVPARSPLDFPISFSSAERSGIETLQLICDTVTVASGRKVDLGIVPSNLLFNSVVQLSANGEGARDVLIKALRALRWPDPRNLGQIPKLSWSLLYGPDTQYYSLNIKGVEQEVRGPTGALRRVPVARTIR